MRILGQNCASVKRDADRTYTKIDEIAVEPRHVRRYLNHEETANVGYRYGCNQLERFHSFIN